ncbi:MAG: hypothetical protein HN548_00580 [Opitutae bacterium]|jgi:hypothetical protein|nr:hypothetical protein [Opitutae bacterium]MBT5715373.1 hypothetical protein [Opitutae bacterium]
MKNIILILSFTLFSGFLCGQENKPSGDYHLGFRIAPRISTLGAGLEVAKGFTPNFGVRAGFNYFSYAYDAKESDVSYDFELELKSFAMFADWHPFKGAFRLSGGLLINGNGLTGNAKPTAPVDIGGTDYSLDSINLDISYNTIAPYVGLGWDTTFGDDDNWGFAFDLGLIYSGSAEAALSVSGPGKVAAIGAGDVKKEQDELQNDLDSLKWWPVVSAGLVYQF